MPEEKLTLKMTKGELEADYAAHRHIIDSAIATQSRLGLPEHLARSEGLRIAHPHVKRANDIAEVLQSTAKKEKE